MQSDGFYPSRKIRQRGSRYWIEFNQLPLFGVFLALLMIMMVSSGAIHHGVGPDLAVVGHPITMRFANREDSIHIAVTRDGRLYFGASRVLPAEVSGRIQESLKNGSDRRIYMVVDARAKYGDVKVVLDEIRGAKVEQVSFLVGKKVP